MSGTTPSQNLVFPTGGDSIQAAGDAVKDLAFRTDARLDAQGSTLSVSQVPPLTVVESKILTNFDRGFTGWSFDTVLVDTQGGADLAADPRKINLTRTGYWMLGGYADATTAPGSVTSAFQLMINVNNSSSLTFEDVQSSQVDGLQGMHGACSTIARVDDATSAYSFMSAQAPGSFTAGQPNTIPITYRRMWAYWLGDL
jgi:hypothetical protein